MSGKQPVIGVTGGISDEWAVGGSAYQSYAAAVENAGAKAIPLGHNRPGTLAECDGLFVSGGWDVHPRHIKPLPGDENLSTEEVMEKYRIKTEQDRDEVEIRLIRDALAAGKPFLGICRGFQVLNIVVGGYLVGDILAYKADALSHFAQEGVSAAHDIAIAGGSIMERCYGSRRIRVNSRHHQGLVTEFVSDRFRVTAVAPDGIVEAVELKDAPFVVGVQWHPEKQADEWINSISKPLFQAFVDACAHWRPRS